MKTHWIIEQAMGNDWDAWTEPVGDDNDTYTEQVQTFRTRKEAKAALEQHFKDLDEDRANFRDEPYDRADFRIVKVDDAGNHFEPKQFKVYVVWGQPDDARCGDGIVTYGFDTVEERRGFLLGLREATEPEHGEHFATTNLKEAREYLGDDDEV
jgi:hypothetical protein